MFYTAFEAGSVPLASKRFDLLGEINSVTASWTTAGILLNADVDESTSYWQSSRPSSLITTVKYDMQGHICIKGHSGWRWKYGMKLKWHDFRTNRTFEFIEHHWTIIALQILSQWSALSSNYGFLCYLIWMMHLTTMRLAANVFVNKKASLTQR